MTALALTFGSKLSTHAQLNIRIISDDLYTAMSTIVANVAMSALAFLVPEISHAEEASVVRHASHLPTSSATTSVSTYPRISTTAANVAIGALSTIFTHTDRAQADFANTERSPFTDVAKLAVVSGLKHFSGGTHSFRKAWIPSFCQSIGREVSVFSRYARLQDCHMVAAAVRACAQE